MTATERICERKSLWLDDALAFSEEKGLKTSAGWIRWKGFVKGVVLMEEFKRRWEKSGMSWMKRDPEDAKRRWENSGMSWMKRPSYNNDDSSNNYNDNDNNRGMGELAENPKRRWEKSGLSWIKRRK